MCVDKHIFYVFVGRFMFVCFLIFEFSDFGSEAIKLSILFFCSFLKARIAEYTLIYTVDGTTSIVILSKAKQALGASLAVATR